MAVSYNNMRFKLRTVDTNIHMRLSFITCLLFAAVTLSVVSCGSDMTPPPAATLPFASYPNASATPTTVPVDTLTGSLRNQINDLEDKMPRADSEGYIIPMDHQQADFAELVSTLESNNPARAASLADVNGYTLTYYVDRGDNKAADYLLREKKPVQKGWGLYAFRVDSTSNIVIEAPHPLFDKGTPSVALDVYRALDARALLVAGAHRNSNRDGSADVAHANESIFQSVHIALSQEINTASTDTIVLQIHGFHTSKHDGYPQVVFGFGEQAQPKEVTLAERIKEALSEQGISSGLCDGNALQDLCAETNVQGSAANEIIFIHIELDESLRRKDEAFIAALVQVFGK
jgi:hypothetical protein